MDEMSKAKRKGTAAETAVVEALIRAGFVHAERRALAGALDKGDVLGVPGWVFEVKAHDSYGGKLPEWLGELEVEVRNANAAHGVVWHKRRGKGSAEDWFVTMTGEQFLRILTELEGIASTMPREAPLEATESDETCPGILPHPNTAVEPVKPSGGLQSGIACSVTKPSFMTFPACTANHKA